MGSNFLLSIMAVVSVAGCSTEAKTGAKADRSAASQQSGATSDASKSAAAPAPSQVLTASADQTAPTPDSSAAADPAAAPGAQPGVAPADSTAATPTAPAAAPAATNAAGTTAAAPAAPVSNVVNFSIKVGTAKNPWNTATTPVVVKVGQTIHVTNNDTVVHQMHTFGNPCPHGSPIAPGKSADCKVGAAIDTVAKPGLLYDHTVGSSALFYVTATK